MKKFIGDFFSLFLSKSAIIIFNLGKAIITARWLGPENNGIIAALTVYPTIFMTVGSLGIRQATTFYVGKNIFPIHSIKNAILQLWVISSIVSVLLCFLLIRYFSSSGENTLLVMLALIPIPFELFNTYNSGIFLGKNQIKEFNKVNWIPPLLIFLVTTVLVIVLDFGVAGAMTAIIAGPLFMSIFLLKKNEFLNSLAFSIDIRILKAFLRLGLIYAFSLLIINMNYKIDVIILDKLSTEYELGIYSKGAQLIEYMWQIPMLFSTIVFARSAVSKDDQAFSLKAAQLLRVSLLAIASVTAVLVLLSNQVITLLFGSAFLPSSKVLVILLPGVLLLTIFKVLNMDLAGKGKPWISMKAMIPALIVNIVLNILFIPKYGANGAALSSTISYSIAAAGFLFFYSKTVGIPIRKLIAYSKRDLDPLFLIWDQFRKQLLKK